MGKNKYNQINKKYEFGHLNVLKLYLLAIFGIMEE